VKAVLAEVALANVPPSEVVHLSKTFPLAAARAVMGTDVPAA
jgi:hypothetical protein